MAHIHTATRFLPLPRHLRRLLTLSLGLLTAGSAFSQPPNFYELGPWANANIAEEPGGGVTLDSLGNLYGAASTGGKYGQGMVYEITKAGVVKDLHDFGDLIVSLSGISWDGAFPRCTVAFDTSGNMYGTTLLGGANYDGEVWEITSAGVYKDLHDFGGTLTVSGKSVPDGSAPAWGVTVDSSGNLYGTTSSGGAYSKYGTVWKLSSKAVYTVMHSFGGELGSGSQLTLDGRSPFGGVTFDSSGNMYGTTTVGGTNDPSGESQGAGVLWKLTLAGTYSVIHEFGGKVTNASGSTGADGSYPLTTVSFDTSGNMYGLATKGGPFTAAGVGLGMLWEYTSKGAYVDLHDFGALTTNAQGGMGADGAFPEGQVKFDKSSNMYGTATAGGASFTKGMIWELSSAKSYEDLHDFGSSNIWTTYDSQISDGLLPNGVVTVDTLGNLYGTCLEGGNGGGCIWTLCNSAVKTLTASPTSVVGGANATATVTLTGAAPVGGFQFDLSSGYSYGHLNVLGGATSGSATFSTSPVSTSQSEEVEFIFEGLTYSASVTVNPPSIASVTLNPTAVQGGNSSTCTVKLNGPSQGFYLSVTTNNANYIYPPSSVYVDYGATSVTFTVYTGEWYSSTSGVQRGTVAVSTPSGSAVSAVLTVDSDTE
jgi:uncharacterized repeat protein (TIGR03803 family)